MWPPWVRVSARASCRFFSLPVFSLGLPFGFSSYIVHLRCMSEWGMVSMFNETAHSAFVRERLLPCRVAVGSMGCIVYTDYVYPAFDPLLADISCLLFLFRKWFFYFICCSSFLFFSLPPLPPPPPPPPSRPCVLSFLLAISYPLVSLPD